MESKEGFFIQSFPALLHWDRQKGWWDSYSPGQFYETYEEALEEIRSKKIQGAKVVRVYNPR